MNETGKNEAPESLYALTATGGDEESFPVLTAFQKLLDAERERARRRVVTLSVWFAGAIIVLLLVFGLLFAMFFGQMIGDGREQQRRLQEQQNALLAMVSSGRLAPGAAEALVDSRAAQSAGPAEDETARALADALRLLDRQQKALDRLLAEKNAPRPAPAPARPAAKPAAEKPAARPPAKPETRNPKPAAKPAAEKPAAKPAAKPAPEKPAAKPAAEKPAKPGVVVAKPPAKPAAPAPQPPAAEPPAEPAADVLAIRPAAGLRVPDGYATDRVEVRTPSGAIVPLRTLLPAE